MKTTLIGAIVLCVAFALPAYAAEGNQPQKGAGPSFEERKADILKGIDQRIARNQQEKTCVQGAKSHEELKACRDKFGPPRRPGPSGQPGGMGGFGGQGRPGGQGAPGGQTPPPTQ